MEADPKRLARELAEVLHELPEEVRSEVASSLEPEVREQLDSPVPVLEMALRRMARRKALGW